MVPKRRRFYGEGGFIYHEEGVGGLHEALLLVLELLELRRRVEQVDVVLEHLHHAPRKKNHEP